MHGNVPLLDARRDERGRPHETNVDAHLAESEQVGPRHPAAQDVSDDGHLQTLHISEDPAEAVQVEEALRGMLARPIARVHHRRVGVPGGHARSSHLRMAHHEDVRPVALQSQDGVLKTLPLGDAG